MKYLIAFIVVVTVFIFGIGVILDGREIRTVHYQVLRLWAADSAAIKDAVEVAMQDGMVTSREYLDIVKIDRAQQAQAVKELIIQDLSQ